ncbi:TAF1 transcription initiation factor TFIID subunit TAF1 [Gymnopus androsaceus JB14]|uniref:TAF1 transcription initiation factor TFIID subunit TAF1 n=1 Tax=Gymnopus androsaceus JB14 TaxID=1447944 RepID=A0A6A4HNH9_9AGAR|nr:TAF1 transcription initiation factor TFIID subunit TAF1 [Gymnopus androsaceus JB14]
MTSNEENDAISALTGFSLGSILGDLNVPSTSLNNQLGISGIPALSSKQIYNDSYDDEDAVGLDQGDDWEDQIDLEMAQEGHETVKMEVDSPALKQKQKRTKIVKRLVQRPKSVYERFPAFEKDKVLDFSELFKGYTVRKSRLGKRQFAVETTYIRKKEVPRGFLDSVAGDAKRQVENKRVEEVISSGSVETDLRRALEERESTNVQVSVPLHDRSFDLVLLSNWEEQIIYEPNPFSSTALPSADNSLTTPVNKVLESGAWTQSIIWTPGAPFRDFTQLEFNHEDDIVPEERSNEHLRPRKRFKTDAVPRDKFNLSNDQYYEVAKDGGRHRVRQTFGQLSVEHAYPAQKLQLPFFKTRLSKQEARSFHRPALQFPTNIELRFTKVRTAKKKKDKAGRKIGKGGNVGEGLHGTGDLSLRDTSNFVLWEYSEEHPPIIPNFGMGSVLVNYYRKKDEKDDHIPKFDLGVPFVLEPQDESPFMKFGYVYPGQTMPALYNNLVRAPLFRHKPKPTDFLVVRSTVKGETKYFLREIKNLFVLGQTYPVTEIIAYKLLRKSAGERLKISRLMKYFPDQNELQMRQRLKEFMEYHRRGPHQGFWRLKPNWPVPSDPDMLKMVTPEQVVLTESMQVGQRHLQDSGYSQTADNADGDESNLSVEQQLAPWITTKNFLYATQAKAMLRLHGEGDPTGRGEAFSFIRISMKEIFVKAGEDYEQKMAEAENRPKSAHRYNVAEQQQIYKSEIERIWKAQFDSLSRRDAPQLTAEDVQRDALKTQQLEAQRQQANRDLTPLEPYSRGPSMDRASVDPEANRRVLRIKRFVDGQWQTEIVRDSAVIRAYIRNRQAIEEENTMTDSLAPTGDADKDKRAKKRIEEELARMKKNQERRLHRKNAKIVKEGGTPLQLNRPIKSETTRRCGHCGQMGHMKTNRKCPRWEEFNSGAAPGPSASAASPSATSPPATPSIGFNRSFGLPAATSPLATSPPLTTAFDDTPSISAPKIKLNIGKKT